MIEENNHIFLAGGDALVYLSNQCTKNIAQHLLRAMHLVRTYLMTGFSTPSPCTHLRTFCMIPSPFHQLRTS